MAGISIQIDAIDNASGILGNVFAMISKGASAMDLVTVAASAAATVIKDSIKSYVEYTDQVRDMARATGLTSQETGRLIQVADDAQMSYASLMTAMRIGLKNGIDPSIEGLAAMSDAYLALAPGAERAQFLLDTFGRSGMEMGKLLSIGSQGIRDMSAAVEDSLAPTEEAMMRAREYEIAVDQLNDSWLAFKMQVAPPVVSALTDIMNKTADDARAMELAKESGETWMFLTAQQQQEFVKLAGAEREATTATLLNADATGEGTEAYIKEEEALKAAEAALKEMTQANMQLFGLVGNLQNETDNYNTSLAGLVKKQSDLQAEIDKASGQKLEDLKKDYDDVGASIDALKQKHADAMNAIAYGLYVAKLQADGFTDAEFNMAMQAGVAFGQVDQATADTAIAMNQITNAAMTAGISADVLAAIIQTAMADGVIDAGELQAAMDKINTAQAQAEISAVDAALAALPTEKNININVTTNMSTALGELQNSPGFGANGIDYSPGGLTWVGEKGPELLALPRGSRVYNHEESMSMANNMAGGQIVNIYGPVTLALQSADSFMGLQ